MRSLAVLLTLLLTPIAVDAQETLQETMRPFEYLVGQWEGPAWYLARDGARVDVIQTEDVYTAAGGHVIVVQGTGYLIEADGTPGEAAFNAFGVLSFDGAAGTHHVDAFNDGRHVRTEARPTDAGFDWGFEAGGRTVRYIVRIDEEGRWVETGEVLVGPDRWVEFVHMTLSRVGE